MLFWIVVILFIATVTTTIIIHSFGNWYDKKYDSFTNGKMYKDWNEGRKVRQVWEETPKAKFGHKCYDSDFQEGWYIATGILLVILIVMGLVILINYTSVPMIIASMQAEQEALIYQFENDIFGTDTDIIGNSELYQKITDWNKDLAVKKAMQRNFWIGIFVPDIYDDFEMIAWNRAVS